jgi:Na+/pantothenate symporter
LLFIDGVWRTFNFLFTKNLHFMSYSNATAILLVAYAGVMLFFAIRGARRTKSLADYALGSQGFSPLVVGLSLAAGITSAATFIINPGFVALYGWSAFLAMSLIIPMGLYGSLVVLTQEFSSLRGFRESAYAVAGVDVAQVRRRAAGYLVCVTGVSAAYVLLYR